MLDASNLQTPKRMWSSGDGARIVHTTVRQNRGTGAMQYTNRHMLALACIQAVIANLYLHWLTQTLLV